MVLDQWKRTYSNARDCYDAMRVGVPEVGPAFWDSFDASGWSVWFCTYLYDSENTVVFKTSAQPPTRRRASFD